MSLESDLAALGIGIGLFSLLLLLIVWTMLWKGIALWKAGRNNQVVWYFFLFIFNTAGILEIIYLLFFQKKRR